MKVTPHRKTIFESTHKPHSTGTTVFNATLGESDH